MERNIANGAGSSAWHAPVRHFGPWQSFKSVSLSVFCLWGTLEKTTNDNKSLIVFHSHPTAREPAKELKKTPFCSLTLPESLCLWSFLIFYPISSIIWETWDYNLQKERISTTNSRRHSHAWLLAALAPSQQTAIKLNAYLNLDISQNNEKLIWLKVSIELS